MINKYTFGGFVFSSVIKLSVLELFVLVPLPPYSREQIDTRFYLHTRDEPNVDQNYIVSAYDLTSLKSSSFDPNKETKFITHGFISDGNEQLLKDLGAALLEYGDYNVLRVDWGKGSLTLPDQALANTKVVGGEIAYFINTLIREFNFDPANCQCIAHSMGAYACGYAGRDITNLGRITALDIAPKVSETEQNEKLDRSDAGFVDVIHTDTKILKVLPSLGDPTPVGHIDINVNGGYDQPGCRTSVENVLDSINELLNEFEVFCNHERSYKYYTEALKYPSCQWVAYECPSYEMFEKGECASCGDDNSKCTVLGPRAEEFSDTSVENRVFYIKTAAESPFCVRHYVVSVSTFISSESTSRSGGTITFEVFGDKGTFSDKLQMKGSDHGKVVKSLFIDPVDVGKISSVKLTWESIDLLRGLLGIKHPLEVNSVMVSPLTHYPESEREMQEVVACLPPVGSPTLIEDGGTKTFLVMTDC